jgi:hypothetical protein
MVLSLFDYLYTRLSKTTRVPVLVFVGVVNAGIAWIVEDAFQSTNPSRGMDQCWNLVFILTVILIGGMIGGFYAIPAFLRLLHAN